MASTNGLGRSQYSSGYRPSGQQQGMNQVYRTSPSITPQLLPGVRPNFAAGSPSHHQQPLQQMNRHMPPSMMSAPRPSHPPVFTHPSTIRSTAPMTRQPSPVAPQRNMMAPSGTPSPSGLPPNVSTPPSRPTKSNVMITPTATPNPPLQHLPPHAPQHQQPKLPQQQLQPTHQLQPQSPTMDAPSTNLDQHKRKRMYPKQSSLDGSSSPTPTSDLYQFGVSTVGYQEPHQQQQQSAISAYSQQPLPPLPQQLPQPQLQQQPHYYQKNMNIMANQFGNMTIGQKLPAVPLLGTSPHVADLSIPEPKIHLPPNVSITNSPYANSDPSYKCCTLNTIPATESLLKKSRLPFALVLAPYRSLLEGDDPVPVVSDSVIARCRRCRTYINPFVTFVEGGQRWKCNMCFLMNDVPAAFDYDANTQQQADRWKRPELNYGCVEFVAPTEYMVRPPQAPAFVIILDVSYLAVQSGILATATQTLLNTLDRLPNEENRTNIAIITVDSALHFYHFDSAAAEPKMLVVADLEDVFLPQPTGLFANLTRNMEGIKSLMEKLPGMFKDTTNVNNAMGPALQAAFKMLSANGGKIICLQSTLPNTGEGALKSREDVKLFGTAKETTLLSPASPFYKGYAVECSRSQIACDMLIFGGQYADVATLSCIPHYTGGQTYYYPGFNASRPEDAMKLSHELSGLLAEQIGLEAVIRIRASRGLRMNAFHGNFFTRSTDLLALPNVPRDQNYCVEVIIEDDLKTTTACFQTALLHTSCTGERRIRVITLCLPVANTISELYAGANQKAIVDYLGNKAVERALTTKLDDARDAIVNKLVDMFGVYKTHVLGQGSGSQLTVPNNLKLLPILALGLIKHDGLRQSSQIPTDIRANAMNLIRTMPLQLLIPYVHANFYSLHNMPPEAGEMTENGILLPPILNLTAEKIEAHGCYLLEDGQYIYLWIGRGVVPQLCKDLFDIPSYQALRGGKYTLPVLETPLNRKVNLLIGSIRRMRRGNYYPTLYLVKEDGDPYPKSWFLSHLIEDRTDNVMSYQQFLQFIKDRVGSGSF